MDFFLLLMRFMRIDAHLMRISKNRRMANPIGNNPDIFLMNWSDLRKTMSFLESTMNVSARRVSITPASLTHPLEFYQTRYQVL